MFHVGCCGFSVGKTKYYESFDLVEAQQTFYQPPSQRVLESWRTSAKEGFRYTMKAWQLITHDPMSPTYAKLKDPIPDFKRLNYGYFKPTSEVWRAWETTDAAARALGANIIVFQCPSGFRPTQENMDNMAAFFKKVRRGGYTFVWEPRGSWQDKDISRLCAELDLVHCVDPFKLSPCYGKIKYLRLQGKGGFKYSYSEAELKELITRHECDQDVYVMFNNSWMYDDALKMKALIATGGG